MPQPDDVAVIVCSRDRPALLRGALAAIRAATPPEVEVLVVDSASRTAATAAVVAEAGVRGIRSRLPGLSIARNVGLATTDRAIAVFTDDDCRPMPGWIDPLLAQFGDERVDAVTGRMLDHTLVGGDGVPDAPPAPVRRFTRAADGLDAGHGALMAFRRERAIALGGFDELLGAGRRFAGAEDLDLLCRVLAAGGTVVADDASVVVHANTREGAEHARLYRGYGLGLGAMLAKWLRRRPGTGIRMLATLAGRAAVRTLRGDARTRAANRALLGGLVGGLGAAAGEPVSGWVFVDREPPSPIVARAARSGHRTDGVPDGA